jgi:hypothetical protein
MTSSFVESMSRTKMYQYQARVANNNEQDGSISHLSDFKMGGLVPCHSTPCTYGPFTFSWHPYVRRYTESALNLGGK